MNECRVCLWKDTALFWSGEGQSYHRCRRCGAVCLESSALPDPVAEEQRYRQHRNDPGDAGYRSFLGRVVTPLLERLSPGSRGLDFGCGPGPALAAMFGEAGHEVALYDPFFAPDPSVLGGTYDFVTATEVVEHLHRPHDEFLRLRGLLRPGGWLGIMTKFLVEPALFGDWRYRRDLTHVTFYDEGTFRYLARRLGLDLYVPEADVVLLQRPADGLTD